MTTIRQRLVWKLLIGWSLLLIVGASVAYITTRVALTHHFDDALRTKAMALSAIIEQDNTGIQVDLGDPFLREFDTNNGTAFFQLWNADGSEVTRSESLRNDALPFQKDASETAGFWNIDLPSGIAARAMRLKFKPHPADAPEQAGPHDALLVVAVDRRVLDNDLTTLALVLAASGVLVLVLTAVMLPRLLERELSPLNRLAEQAQRISAESLGERFPTDALPGELAPISARLNDLLQRLQTSFARERQFSDDLAHEFRTPIAELRSLAELSLKWPDARNADTDRNTLAIAQQMESIISCLLAIARSEQGQLSVAMKPISLAPLISMVCQPLESRMKARELSLSENIPATLEIHSDPVLLRSIVTNLLDNAVEYSASRGTVQIHSEQQNGNFFLRVTNPAPQLSATDVPHLFERFWRKDPARSGGEHSGLGLSLAQAFAKNLGYTLTANLNANSDLIMTLSGTTKPSSTFPPPPAKSERTDPNKS